MTVTGPKCPAGVALRLAHLDVASIDGVQKFGLSRVCGLSPMLGWPRETSCFSTVDSSGTLIGGISFTIECLDAAKKCALKLGYKFECYQDDGTVVEPLSSPSTRIFLLETRHSHDGLTQKLKAKVAAATD